MRMTLRAIFAFIALHNFIVQLSSCTQDWIPSPEEHELARRSPAQAIQRSRSSCTLDPHSARSGSLVTDIKLSLYTTEGWYGLCDASLQLAIAEYCRIPPNSVRSTSTPKVCEVSFQLPLTTDLGCIRRGLACAIGQKRPIVVPTCRREFSTGLVPCRN